MHVFENFGRTTVLRINNFKKNMNKILISVRRRSFSGKNCHCTAKNKFKITLSSAKKKSLVPNYVALLICLLIHKKKLTRK
jgi:hypothetical protein